MSRLSPRYVSLLYLARYADLVCAYSPAYSHEDTFLVED
jgi:hypothetical protein